MKKRIEIALFPDQIHDEEFIRRRISKKIRIPLEDIDHIEHVRRSIDARGKRPLYRNLYEVYVGESFHASKNPLDSIRKVTDDDPHIIIVGAGPAGYFAALRCLRIGLKPIVLDRGKDVQERRRDLRAIQQHGIVNPHSNYCFGEGGAGTYSDGKLYTRSHKRGKIVDVLDLLVAHGATPEILIDAHPHIGSNKLPRIIAQIRETIESYGGEVRFDSHVTDFLIDRDCMKGVVLASGEKLQGEAIILATGHSARDIYRKLHEKNITIEAKPFALGLRIEHPQSYIDEVQYNQHPREDELPAASYKVVTQVNHCGVFSFCMCPGGLIVPAATAPGEIVVNGMSLSKRDSPYANSGFVTSIEIDELFDHGYKGVFGCMDFQAEVEKSMFQAGDGSQKAPAQRVDDFVKGKVSSSLPDSSYIPGLFSADLKKLLPSFVYDRLRRGLIDIDKKMKGYITAEAQLVGVESRTSAPIRIPRDRESFMHEEIKGLFPCGEGAGYAGGILSAAMDGQNCAEAALRYVKS